MNTDQKERLLKLAETDPVLAHKVADFMNAGNTASEVNAAQQAVSEAAPNQGTDAKDLKWTDALLAQGILSSSVSGLGTVVLNNGNTGTASNTGNTGASEKLTVTKEQLWWARVGFGAIVAGVLSFLVTFLMLFITSSPQQAPSASLFFSGCIMFLLCLAITVFASTKSEIPTMKTFLSKNFTIQ